jgi:predicted lactoylglutathione lyase
MATKIFVNLPVKDLARSKDFFSALGYSFNPQFTDDKAACLVISEDIFAMLLTEPFFKTFIPGKEISNSKNSTEVLVALSADSREMVDTLADKALTHGGAALRDPEDHGFMYSRSFQDPDGHIWEVLWMDPAAVNK